MNTAITILIVLIAVILPAITLILGYALGVREERARYADLDEFRGAYVQQLLDDLDESVQVNADLLDAISRHPASRHLSVVSE